ncbi:histamine H1 receptor-like isoform X1 [Tachypleus tridentatus]|uniref:histamine H1 receptor-like isoform X1 n=1 Tax=Tachypleus tridentatus TaxID=6853 RepID=UPI003FD53CED
MFEYISGSLYIDIIEAMPQTRRNSPRVDSKCCELANFSLVYRLKIRDGYAKTIATRRVSNMFIMSLAVADVTVGMIVMPISSAYAITGNWKFGIIVCQFWLSVDYTASTASILNLFILSLDRYWSIRSPLKYMRKRTKKRALIMIGIVWLVSSLWIVPIIGWHFWYNNGIRKHPNDVCETEFADNVLFKLSTSTANFYLPLILMLCLYVKIFTEIKKRSSSEIGQCNQGQERRELAGDFINPSEGGIEREQNLRPKKVKWHSSGSRTPKGFEQHQETSIPLQQKREFEEEEKIQDTNLMPTVSQLAGSEKRHSKILKMGRPYQQLTLLSVPRLNSDQEFFNKHFDNVVINVEVTGNNGSEDKGSVFLESEKVLTCDSRSETFLSSAENLDIKQRRSGFGFRKTYSRETNHNNISKDNIELNSMVDQLLKPRNGHFSRNRYSKNIENYVTHWDSLTRPRTGSTFRARFLPHFTAAFPLRVTKKTLASNLRQQKKAARQLGVIMGAFIMCWLPYIIIFIVTAYCEDCIDPQIHTATIWLGYLNSTMNPFLYALCNDNFKRAFKKIFRSTSKGTNFFTASNTKRTDHRFA